MRYHTYRTSSFARTWKKNPTETREIKFISLHNKHNVRGVPAGTAKLCQQASGYTYTYTQDSLPIIYHSRFDSHFIQLLIHSRRHGLFCTPVCIAFARRIHAPFIVAFAFVTANCSVVPPAPLQITSFLLPAASQAACASVAVSLGGGRAPGPAPHAWWSAPPFRCPHHLLAK